MEKNEKDPLARTLTYVEFPTKFVWKKDERIWDKRIIGKTIGRIHCVNPSMGEAYFLRILLNKVVGPKSFEEIRTMNGEVFPTFRDTCYARGLLDDVKEYIEAIKEAYYIGSGYYLRNLFAKMLASNTLSRLEHVWENTWEYLSDGILYNRQKLSRIEVVIGLSLPEEQIRNLTLMEIERYLLRNNSSLSRFPSMPQPGSESIYSAYNRLIADELRYDVSATAVEFHNNLSCLTDEQRLVFDEIIEAVNSNAGGVFFVYGYRGTGKTFLWKTLSASIRCKGDIVLNVASSGIAYLLLPGGRAVHSRKTKLIIWDEAPMNHKHAFEALDRTMKDIFKCEMIVGGKVMVFGGDFRQILPVVPKWQ
ncbi:putative DNA helicase [Helianthus annuus]|nr:putative DNA helicase [Helianthus annuus]